MRKTAHGLTTILVLATIAALVGITACTEMSAPHHDCPTQNGSEQCQPG
jgi:hypothetical protein